MNYIDPKGGYHEGDIQPGDTPCAKRPTPEHRLSDNWQTDPMNPAVCWRPLNASELDAIKTAASDLDTRLDPLDRAIVLQLLDEINQLRTALALAPRTAVELRAGVKSRL